MIDVIIQLLIVRNPIGQLDSSMFRISQRRTSNLLATRWAIAPRFVRQTRYSGRTDKSKTRFAFETNGGARNETTYCPGSMFRGFRGTAQTTGSQAGSSADHRPLLKHVLDSTLKHQKIETKSNLQQLKIRIIEFHFICVPERRCPV